MVLPRGPQEDQQPEKAGESLTGTAKAEIEQKKGELSEIVLMIEQSHLEVNKLTQRNTTITSRLQQVQSQFDSMPRIDIRSAYDAALDAQQRLFLMRGQLDKLQSDRNHIEAYVALLERLLQTLEGGTVPEARARGGATTGQTVEMMIRAQESERQRLARQMHDGPAQALSNFILQTEIAMRLFDLDQQKAKEELVNLKTSATSTFQKVRDFITELRPMSLDDLGLAPTLLRNIETLKSQTGIDIRLTVTGLEQRLESYLEVMIFRAVQELVGNAIKHSGATNIKVQIDSTETDVRVNVDDNGKGFDVALIEEGSGMGLKVIRDRVEMLGGRLEVDSVAGQGSRISFQIPAAQSKVFA
jgi:two-component system sensor histidine kinase DegS